MTVDAVGMRNRKRWRMRVGKGVERLAVGIVLGGRSRLALAVLR